MASRLKMLFAALLLLEKMATSRKNRNTPKRNLFRVSFPPYLPRMNCISRSLKLDIGKTSFCKETGLSKAYFILLYHTLAGMKSGFSKFSCNFQKRQCNACTEADVKKADEAFYRSKAAFFKEYSEMLLEAGKDFMLQ